MKPATYNPAARVEADEAAAYYHQRNPVKAREFLDELAFVIDEIRYGPQRWPFERGTRVQRLHLRRFPFTVYYREGLHEIYILAVAHTSRRPGYWKSRIAA
ncbi:MAG TPA: type II toxin-antitoxin system RelE/ParE family toxin [Candidatus Methylacidiphilales bacterium]|nr:type II toxin-antitoxin system RelE/ParE family toxin [Candidatus Methylacidiphilales bacterium]